MPLRYLVTAGPTREPLDAVRFLSNYSSGKMGFAIAAAAAAAGHQVRLIAGPVDLPTPDGVNRVDVESADEMARVVEREFDGCDVLVMAAAVADWRPAERIEGKSKKGHDRERMVRLVRTPDILAAAGARKAHRFVVGFAAEAGAAEAEAQRKLAEKHLDLVVANNLLEPDAGFGVDTNRVSVLDRDGGCEPWPTLSKQEVAARLVARIDTEINPGTTP